MPAPRPFSPRVSRRRFLQGTAAVPLVPLVAGARRPQPHRDDPDVLRVGLVGCGGRGTGAASQALKAEDGTVVLTAVADVFPERMESCLENLRNALGEERAGRVQVEPDRRHAGFDGFRELMAGDVDVVLLASPPHFRPAQLAAAAERGLHVFAEKPWAVDAPGMRSVMASVEQLRAQRKAIVSGFCWRYNAPHRELWKRVHDGALGEIRSYYSTYNASPLSTHPREAEWDDMTWQLKNWQHFLWLSGDHIVEQAVHSLDKMAWTMRDAPPEKCVAIGGRQARTEPEHGNVFDHFSVTWQYPGEVQAFHMCRQMAGCANDNSDWIHGEKGVATIRAGAGIYEISGENEWFWEGEGNDMYQQEHDDLFASIRAGTPVDDGDWAAKSCMLAIMGRMAAYTGQEIRWEQALASEDALGPVEYAFGPLEFRPVPVPGKTKFV